MGPARMEQTPERLQHLCAKTWRRTFINTTPPAFNFCGGPPYVWRLHVFLTFHVLPYLASDEPSSSNENHALSNERIKKISTSSANRKCNTSLRLCSRDGPSTSMWARHEDKAISSTETYYSGIPPASMATIVPAAWSLSSKTVPASGHFAIKKARRKKRKQTMVKGEEPMPEPPCTTCAGTRMDPSKSLTRPRKVCRCHCTFHRV